ncbi:MAG: YceI family protein [Solirubrobacteraceae bacterium]
MRTRLRAEGGIFREPTTWVLDPVRSSVGFEVRQAMISTLRGYFKQFEGTLEAAEGPRGSRVSGSVQLASIDTGDAGRDTQADAAARTMYELARELCHRRDTGPVRALTVTDSTGITRLVCQRVGGWRTTASPQVFNAERYPRIRFEARSIEHLHLGTYRVTGELTINDVTRGVGVEASVEDAAAVDALGRERVGITVRGVIDRTEFALSRQPVAGGRLPVREQLAVRLDISAVRA